MDWITKRPIAHRGLHKGFSIPENSMEAFKNAILNDYTIELDVRITKDEKIVVFHDKNLIRLCGVRKKIQNQKYENLKNYKLYNSEFSIPLLQEVLEFVNDKVPVLIEIKNYSNVGNFEKQLCKILDNYRGRFAVCSFNPEVVFWFKNKRPNYLRALVFGDIKKFEIKYYNLVFLYRYYKLRPHFISLDYKLLNTFIQKFCRYFKIPLLSWTIDSKKKQKKAQCLSDNVIFENVSHKK